MINPTISLPMYAGQCLPLAVAALTDGDGDAWSRRLGYDKPERTWAEIAAGMPEWPLLVTRDGNLPLFMLNKAQFLGRTTVAALVRKGFTRGVIVIGSRRYGNARNTHAIAVNGREVYDPAARSRPHLVSEFSRCRVRFAWAAPTFTTPR